MKRTTVLAGIAAVILGVTGCSGGGASGGDAAGSLADSCSRAHDISFTLTANLAILAEPGVGVPERNYPQAARLLSAASSAISSVAAAATDQTIKSRLADYATTLDSSASTYASGSLDYDWLQADDLWRAACPNNGYND